MGEVYAGRDRKGQWLLLLINIRKISAVVAVVAKALVCYELAATVFAIESVHVHDFQSSMSGGGAFLHYGCVQSIYTVMARETLTSTDVHIHGYTTLLLQDVKHHVRKRGVEHIAKVIELTALALHTVKLHDHFLLILVERSHELRL